MTAQARNALAEAQAVRRERAARKRELAQTRPRAAAIAAGLAVLAAPPARVAGMTIRDLLGAIYGVGPIRTREVLDATGINPALALGQLSVEHRRRLTRALAALIGPRPTGPLGARRRTPAAGQDGAPAARAGTGDGPAAGGASRTRSRDGAR